MGTSAGYRAASTSLAAVVAAVVDVSESQVRALRPRRWRRDLMARTRRRACAPARELPYGVRVDAAVL
jgi:hypothetical protein